MPAPFLTNCMKSIVRNISGVQKTYGFLPPHGRTLDDQEEMTLDGNVLDAITRGRSGEQRLVKAFLDCMEDGDIMVKSTDAPILYDETDDVTKMLQLDNGTLSDVDPCWESSDT